MDFGDPQFWLNVVLYLVVFILSLTVHEYAHARVAFALGDDTAARQGRMTLNPIVHIDPIGTILMPILGARGIPVIGWAKPVPVSPINFTRKLSMRTGHALVAVAGPTSNLILAFVCTVLLWVVAFSGVVPDLPNTVEGPLFKLLVSMAWVNVALAVFNLLPIPPLDGSRLLPQSLDGLMETLGRYSFVLFIAIIIFGRSLLTIPILFIISLLFALFGMDFADLYNMSRTLSGG